MRKVTQFLFVSLLALGFSVPSSEVFAKVPWKHSFVDANSNRPQAPEAKPKTKKKGKGKFSFFRRNPKSKSKPQKPPSK
jgi:hypothetical protein